MPVTTQYDDFDAFLSETSGPVYAFKWQGHEYAITGIDIEAFAEFGNLGDRLEAGMSPADMIRVMKDMVASQLSPTDRVKWAEARPPWPLVQRVCERIAEAATGRPIEGLPSSGSGSEPTGQPSKENFSSPGILPPPYAD